MAPFSQLKELDLDQRWVVPGGYQPVPEGGNRPNGAANKEEMDHVLSIQPYSEPTRAAVIPAPTSSSTSSRTTLNVPPSTSSASSSASVTSSPTSPTATPTSLPALSATSPSLQPTPSATRPPRLGVNDDTIEDPKVRTVTMTWTAAASSLPTATGTALQDTVPATLTQPDRGSPLSPGAEHSLIAVGVIGGTVIVAIIVFLTLRFMRVDLRSLVLGRNWQPFRERPPPEESRRDTFSNTLGIYNEKGGWEQQRYEQGNNTRDAYPPMTAAVPASAPRGNTPQQQSYRLPYPTNAAATTVSWGLYSYYAPQTTTRQSSHYDRNATRMSTLSSLSSGFGDAEINVPESGPTRQNTTATRTIPAAAAAGTGTNRPEPTSRFSWTTTTPKGLRDTVYSTDEPARFRTINSWVVQQSSHVQRQAEAEAELHSMPALPGAAAGARSPPSATAAPQQQHCRFPSEMTDAAFRAHPGEEVKLNRGSRVASAILNRFHS